MKTCWLENDEAFAKKDADKPYIDYKINNLPSFLQKINVLKTINQKIMSNLENIINDAWENKDQVNQNSDQSIKGCDQSSYK